MNVMYSFLSLTCEMTAMMMAEDLSTTATRLAVSTFRAIIVIDCVIRQKTPEEKLNHAHHHQTRILTNHDNFQFIHQIRSLQLNIHNKDCEEGHDDEDDLSAGGETGHVKLLQISDDNGHVTVERSTDEDQYCRHDEIVLISLLLCVNLLI